MLSHVEMAPAAGGFKLFGKVITQCAAPSSQAEPPAPRPAFVRERSDPDESDQPTVKREAYADQEFEKQHLQQHGLGGGEEQSKAAGGHPPRGAAAAARQHQDTLEARAAALASSAPPLPCPRCRSRNTKFCYFNNYNVNQPRHFCKDCHRYWTAGGALRNVPVGAGRRKNRPLGPVVAAAAAATVPGHHHHHHQQQLQLQHHRAAAAAGFVLGFPSNNPSSPTSPPVYADRWPVCPDRRF